MLPFQSSVPAFQAVRTHNENIYINWMARAWRAAGGVSTRSCVPDTPLVG